MLRAMALNTTHLTVKQMILNQAASIHMAWLQSTVNKVSVSRCCVLAT